jgi:anti-sigma-K factor RskA
VAHLDPDRLVLLALDEEQADEAENGHVGSCAVCHEDLAAMRAVAGLARETEGVRELPRPPERVWEAIAAQTLGATAGAARTADVLPLRRRRLPTGVRMALVGAAAMLLGIAGTVAVIRLVQPAPRVVAVATLTPQAPAAAGASGRAELLDTGRGTQLRVTLHGMPAPDGYYEVWLYDGTSRMIGLGDVGSGSGSTVVNVPGTADTDVFRVVDISAQRLGQQEHGRSMLQGSW